ncbi:MAG: large conductance mechanosensitive channel protein MscL, partial [Pseudomonadota bacterium]
MGMLQEFKDFALKSNFLDMATGIVIGAAVGTVVKSLVEDVIMPPIGMLMGGVDFSDIKIPLSDGPDAAAINIGTFFNNLISVGAAFSSSIICCFAALNALMMRKIA